MRLLLLLTALVVTLVIAQPTIKSNWAQVNENVASPENEMYFVAPRAAGFSDGRFIVVYTIVTNTSEAFAVGRIFNADGSVAVAEFALDEDKPADALLTAPNVVVFNDDTFLVVYRWDNAGVQLATILARRYYADAQPVGAPFQVDYSDMPSTIALQDGVELIGFADKSFAIIYFSSSAGSSVAVVHDSLDRQLPAENISPLSEGSVGAAIVGNRSRTTSYFASETGGSDIVIGEINGMKGYIDPQQYSLELSPITDPAIALTGYRTVTVLYSFGESIHYSIWEAYVTFSSSVLFAATNAVSYFSPAIVGLNETTVFIAYKQVDPSAEGAPSYLVYQTASIVPGVEIIELVPSSSTISVTSNLRSLQFIPMRGSDLLVIGKSTEDSSIMRQILTFCGNGRIELNEECDGTGNCDANCRCTNGLVGYQGICGLPNIIPTLDCVEVVASGYNLHFSFINEDGVEQIMEHGYQNYFTPSNVGGNRPTTFSTGSTRTYPASPFTTFVASSVPSINWVLGSYNLTVDLTDVTAMQCPENPGFVADVTSFDYIYDDGEVLAQNFAARYNISPYRLTYYSIQTGGSVPSKKRAYYDNRYDITVLVAPANETNSEEPKAAEAVRSVIEDHKKNSTRVEEELLNGYDPDSGIKDITPTPTGVEVRGTRYDSSNVTPPMSAPITENSPQTLVIPQQATSGSMVVLPSLVATILYALVA